MEKVVPIGIRRNASFTRMEIAIKAKCVHLCTVILKAHLQSRLMVREKDLKSRHRQEALLKDHREILLETHQEEAAKAVEWQLPTYPCTVAER